MDQSRALNALAPFLALAKSATSPRAAADLITQATSAPNTYVFAELLQQPNIASLAGNEQYGRHYELLMVFAWGTWESYKAASGLPALSDAQTLKLRLLSLLTYAAETRRGGGKPESNLSYASLSARLDLASPLDLEHLVTTAIYNNLLTATLNPSRQTVVVTSLSPLRDLAPGSIASLLTSLSTWSARCDAVLLDLQAEIATIEQAAQRRAKGEQKREKQVAAALDGGEGKGAGAGGGRGTRNSGKREVEVEEEDGEGDEMDVDGGNGGGKKRGSGGVMGGIGRVVGRGR